METVGQLAAFLAKQGMPTDVAYIRREHVEAFITHLLERWKPGHGQQPLPGPPALLQVAGGGGGDQRVPDGQDEASQGA